MQEGNWGLFLSGSIIEKVYHMNYPKNYQPLGLMLILYISRIKQGYINEI
jgi:hypothetical protein